MALNFCNNNSLSAITSIPAAISGGALNLISTSTASDSSTISFTSGLDSTYKEYIFKFINIHPDGGTGRHFSFQGSTDGGSSYGVTITSNYFQSQNNASENALEYDGGQDLAQSTNFQMRTHS